MRAVRVVALLVFAYVVYRSIALAVTYSEAITYTEFASQSLPRILTAPLQPSNQILHSILCRYALRIFRVNELSLRLASLLGVLFYFWAALRISTALSRSSAAAASVSLVFVLNPFLIGWLPESTGTWMAAGLFLVGLQQMVQFSGQGRELTPASLAFGLCMAFQIAFVVPILAVILIFLHFEFWGARRLSVVLTLNALILPFTLVTFVVWSLPLVSAIVASRVLAPAFDWIVVVPGLLALSISQLVSGQTSRKILVTLSSVLLVFAAVFRTAIPDHFHAGPEIALARVARALRDDIRRLPLRPVRVSASESLVEPMNFYRRRYALGAVLPVTTKTPPERSDYLIAVESDLASLSSVPKLKIFNSQSLTLFRRDLP